MDISSFAVLTSFRTFLSSALKLHPSFYLRNSVVIVFKFTNPLNDGPFRKN